MTEAVLRAVIIRSALAAFQAGEDCHDRTIKALVPPRLHQARQAAVDAALEMILPVAADLVQQALEDGFDGRACPDTDAG